MTRQVLSISSQVIYGPVGNTATVPALQAAGFTVLQVPTIILSNHPGNGKPSGLLIPSTDIEAYLEKLAGLDVLNDCMGVFTGYFADAAQVSCAAAHIRKMKIANPEVFVLVDPVIGDGEDLYVPVDVANTIRNELLPLADCITPNRFELSWLSGLKVTDRPEAVTAAIVTRCEEVLATSIPVDDASMATMAICSSESVEVITRLKPSVPHGTGDFLAGLYLACRLNGYEPAQALTLSQALVDQAIVRSVGQPWLDIVGALHDH